ncbi:MAG: RNA polymerase sigma factor [Phycisphaerales bacterium]
MLTTQAPATLIAPTGPAVSEPLSAEQCARVDASLLLAWCRAHGLQAASCADVLQEVFLRLLSTRPVFACRAAQVAWLRRVTSNLCVDVLRKGTALTFVAEVSTTSSEVGVSHEEQRALANAVRELSEMQRLVLIAKAVEQVTFAALAADLDISIPTAKTHYRRAIDALRIRLLALNSHKEPKP